MIAPKCHKCPRKDLNFDSPREPMFYIGNGFFKCRHCDNKVSYPTIRLVIAYGLEKTASIISMQNPQEVKQWSAEMVFEEIRENEHLFTDWRSGLYEIEMGLIDTSGDTDYGFEYDYDVEIFAKKKLDVELKTTNSLLEPNG